jgi:hypothetical protein
MVDDKFKFDNARDTFFQIDADVFVQSLEDNTQMPLDRQYC